MTASFDVRVIPRARKSEIAGTRNNAVLVRVTSAPTDGAANAELIELLAEALGVPRRAVTIVAGLTSRTKRLVVEGVSGEDVKRRLGLQ